MIKNSLLFIYAKIVPKYEQNKNNYKSIYNKYLDKMTFRGKFVNLRQVGNQFYKVENILTRISGLLKGDNLTQTKLINFVL